MSYAPIPSESTLKTQPGRAPKTTVVSLKRSENTSIRTQRKKAPGRRGSTATAEDYSLIVHCHLCWDWVWQRPQQFVSRLSRRHETLFVETLAPDPSLVVPVARFRAVEDYANLTVLSLQFPSWRWSDGAFVDAERRRLVKEFLSGPGAGHFANPVQWFYDPMAVTAFAGRMGEVLTVYDCMDELSKFRGAPPQIAVREQELLARADVVFTGGRKLYEAKSRFHDNCHFYGCGVDGNHFGKARAESTRVPEDVAKLRKPVLGYFGVVDERMDYELVTHLADANPDWSVAIIGPAIKVDSDSLPRRANLHWLGQRAYADLPAYCKGFDVCLMPFALNEATEFINPTKALEYMATGRPIVSTAVSDVVRNFGNVVKIGGSREEFTQLCRQAIEQPDGEAVARGLKMAEENSWDSIVAKLEGHVAETLAPRSARPTNAGAGAETTE